MSFPLGDTVILGGRDVARGRQTLIKATHARLALYCQSDYPSQSHPQQVIQAYSDNPKEACSFLLPTVVAERTGPLPILKLAFDE